MAIQTINLGNYANDGTGDDLRTAFTKVNANFSQLSASDVSNGANLGALTGNVGNIFKQRNVDGVLEFKTLTSNNNSVTFTQTDTTIDLASTPSIVVDTNPQLGGDLDLQGHRIYNGNTETTVYGFDIPGMAALVKLMVESNQVSVDFNGGYENGFDVPIPTTASLDFNGTGNINFLDSAGLQLDLDLGTF